MEVFQIYIQMQKFLRDSLALEDGTFFRVRRILLWNNPQDPNHNFTTDVSLEKAVTPLTLEVMADVCTLRMLLLHV